MPAPVARALHRHGILLAGLFATFPLASCIPDAGDVSGTGGVVGTGGQTGSGGATPGSGGATPGTGGAAPGTGGATPGSGGARPGTGGATTGSGGATPGTGGAGTGGVSSSGGRQGGNGSGGRAAGGATGTGGASGGAGGGSTAALPAGYALCVPCHGETGAGVAGMGVDIQHPVVDFSTWVIRNGRVHPDFPQPMVAYTAAVLPDAQLQGILSYLAARPKPTTGQGLYVDYCANCHGADAAGGVTMRPIANENMTAFTTNVRGGHHPGEFSLRRDYMPKWTAAELSDAEIRLIFTYVSGL